MINRWIASVFAGLLTVIHLVVLVALLGIILLYFSDNHQFRNLPAAFGVNDNGFLAIVAVTFVIYVLVVGALATLIAINQNLERLNKAIAQQRNPAPYP
jgi:hypothetical protein